jgi:cysteinyl-tRNA synthetase
MITYGPGCYPARAMVIRIYDSLRREKIPLDPIQPGKVGLYACGPTVYDDCHIGHLMGPVVFDTIARWIRARGYEVRFVNNITDIDDKIIQRAAATGEEWSAIAERYTEQYFEYLRDLNVETITDHPRCTEYVGAMTKFIAELIAEDRAYETSDGVYFDVVKQQGYGKLSGRKVEDMQAGARVQAADDLRHPADFALWKKAKPGEPTWESPWGAGRPGWHIECSVMSRELLGGHFDLHGGGDDLKFPHHENEIAQSEAHGDRFADLWMHHGLVQYSGRKIAKSDPRMQDPEFAGQFKARKLVDTYSAAVLRFFLVRGPYRRPVDFEPKNLEDARKGLGRILGQLGDLAEQPRTPDLDQILARDLPQQLSALREKFCSSMDDDFGTGDAVAQLFTLARFAREGEADLAQQALALLRDLGRTIGLFLPGDAAQLSGGGATDERLAAVLEALLTVRDGARANKDFATADGVRDLIAAQGIEVQDGAQGSTFSVDGANEQALANLLDGALDLRRAARERKDFATSDAIRDGLTGAGVTVEDSPDGSSWSVG